MLIIKLIRISFIFFLFNNFSILKADIKKSIIENINNSESLKFDFVQIANERKETGICFLKRPYYLKCEYNDKNKKELIVNRKRLVIYHKRYDKIYNYPLSKSYFSEILNKEKFGKLINNGTIKKEKGTLLVDCLISEKGQIIFYFTIDSFDLKGWDLISLDNSKISFKILNTLKNSEIKKDFFNIPDIN